MQEIKYTYNGEKENAVFAVKLRGLFEDRKKTHRELAEYIEEVTGESVTRQAIGQWCNGNTCPNLKTVPIIAEFFGVTCDYLLTETEIKTTVADLTAACKYTGLSEEAIEMLKHDFSSDSAYLYKADKIVKIIMTEWRKAASLLIEKGYLTKIVADMVELEDRSAYASDVLLDFDSSVHRKIEHEFNISPVTLMRLIDKKTQDRIANTPKPNYADEQETEINIMEQCDLLRYRLIKCAEEISNLFDRRKDWLNYSCEELLEHLGVTEEELKEMEAQTEKERSQWQP